MAGFLGGLEPLPDFIRWYIDPVASVSSSLRAA
jgi:hypothetical protein